jgi:CRISPR-associated endonuclease/helicase Cas3
MSSLQLVEHIHPNPQALTICNTKDQAQTLFQILKKLGGQNYHLSTLMCPEHRSQTLKEIREKIKQEKPIKVISTQLIEAGVDVDFPVVYRAMAGLDSIAQAAGRCNRNG